MTPLAPARPAPAPVALALLALAPEVVAFTLGNLATFPNLPWYATLRKPGSGPPDWVFGPAWTLLYLLMALALYRVLRGRVPEWRTAAAAFGVRIALNAARSWAFFAARSPPLASR